MATLTHHAPFTFGHAFSGPRSLLARLQAWNTRRRDYAETMSALAQLDTRDLSDLSISRYDFEAIARGDFRRG